MLARYIAPSAELLAAPDAAIKASMDASNIGVENATLILQFMIAQLDAALQKWRLALAAGIAERNS
jgi:hypothetical protein